LTEVLVKNRFAVGDRLEWITPEGNEDLVLDDMEDMHGQPLQLAAGGGWQVRLRLPVKNGMQHGLLSRYLQPSSPA
jgi:putative protease